MKQKLQMIISASAASVLVFSALAQNTPNSTPERSGFGGQRQANPRADRLNGAVKTSDLIGMEVKNRQDEKLGKVEDLAVDMESGRIVQVILSTGGFIGIGDTLSAVPPGALHHDVAQKVLHLDATKEKLQSAPKFEMSKWGESADSQRLSTVYRHYGQESAYTFVQPGDVVADGQRNQDGQRNADRSPNTISTRRPDGTWDKDRISTGSRQNQNLIPTSRLSQVQQASKLVGTSVKNLQDEKLGDVDNILVDLTSGRIVAVVVSSGGFLGMGDELSAVPPTALRFSTDRETLQLDASKEALSQAPHFKSNQWPDFAEPTYASGVYRAYRVEPYFATDGDSNRRNLRDGDANRSSDNTARNVRDRDERNPADKSPDNTARNVRDRDDRTLTPFDQGNSKADVDTTAQIRKEVIAGKNLSTNARNVKIITNQGRVTLRGPVNSAEEKRLIGDIATRIARAGNVDNQLEVKFTTTSNN